MVKKIGGAVLKILFFALLLLAAYRLVQKITQPDILFKIAHCFFLLLVCCWTAWMAATLWKSGTAPPGDPPPVAMRSRESFALLGVTALSITAFILVAQSRLLAGKPPVESIPWVYGFGHFVPAMAAGLAFVLLLWLFFGFLNKTVPGHDPWLFPLAAFLTAVGLVLLYRLAPDLDTIFIGKGYGRLFVRQFRSLAVSLLVFYISIRWFTFQRIERLTRKRYVWVLISIILITVTALFGTEIHGRRLSVNLGVMNFQTVELVKVLALFFMVGYFRSEMPFMESGKNILGLPRQRYLLPYLTMWLLTLLPIFMQKDLGPTALIFALFLAVFYLGTESGVSVMIGILIMTAAGIGSYYGEFPSMVKTRIDMWLDPFHHSQNMAEVMWALAGGGWLGSGTGRGLCHYIPVVQSDFNFVAIAEEWGFLGAGAVIACFGLLVWRTLTIARNAPTPYIQLLLAGIGALWMIQTFVIVGGNIGLLPLTGITLPFISFGGSSLVVNFLLLGVVVRFSGDMGNEEMS